MIKLVDLSHYEMGFDFRKAVTDGVVGMMTKASEGLGLDTTCGTLCQRAKAAGMKYTGLYHFFHASLPVQAQVDKYFSQYSAVKTEMPPILDLEETSVNGHSYSSVKELALQWLTIAEEKSGKIPILYIDMNMIGLLGILKDARFNGFGLWVARYSKFQPPMHWDFWQFSDGTINAAQAEQHADTDWFAGSEVDLRKFLGVA